MRRVLLFSFVLVLAACGGSKRAAPTTTAPAKPRVEVLYQAEGWRIIRPRGRPILQHRVGSAWKASPAGQVTIDILSPKPNSVAAAIPQVAAQFTGKSKLVEAGIWLDGVELPVNGGGTATSHTFYGAPASKLPPGKQAVIAYARTARGGAVVRWTFTVK